eukprot:Phypoly_transcript_12779.p1 GENE.Phypoly_transcript_12779~~Phypoly_transcript_12779.p1  ORF type:complete len:275 (+),score=49.74 Phypoly_transcript_12779:171-995(+)
MAIIYAVVARGSVVLAEHTDSQGNFVTVTQRILEKIPNDKDDMRSYLYDKYIFHYIVFDGITYLCMADESFGRRIPYAFLDNIKSRFLSSYGENAKTAMAYGMNADFARVLQIQMNFYSKDPEADKINKVRGEIDEVKSVLVADIEKVLERGEKIELLVEQTESLQHNAFAFKKGSTQLKHAMWWKNMKITIILIFVILILVYFALALACGWRLQKCISKAKDITNTTTSSTSTISTISTLSITSTSSSATNGATGVGNVMDMLHNLERQFGGA